ncbi:MAG: sensor histidine kinase [Acidimicrobiales bacterium]
MVSWVVRRWAGPGRVRAFDVGWACVVTVISVGALWVRPRGGPDLRHVDPLGVGLALGSSVPLVWRRSHATEVMALVGVAAVSLEVLRYPNAGAACVLVALYTVAAMSDRRRSLQALGATAAAILIVLGVNWHNLTVIDVVANYVVFATAWILGDNVRTRRKYVAELEDKAVRLEAEREAQARRATADERTRIARELHDVVAHSVSVMTVQAGAARRVLDRAAADPAVREAMATIETTGREALAELRRVVGVLREDGESAGLGPQPGVADLPALVARAQDAGLSVDLSIEGEPRPLPSGVDLSAYRIVQEALTNAFKHAGPARARVRVCYGTDAVEVQVVDDGRGAAADPPPPGGGNGLVGMRERVTLFGGELKAGPRGGGGYEVKARLPVSTAAGLPAAGG